MKYHLTIWTDDGIKRELDAPEFAPFISDSRSECVQIRDSEDKVWFFNWSHVLGGTIKKIEEKDERKES